MYNAGDAECRERHKEAKPVEVSPDNQCDRVEIVYGISIIINYPLITDHLKFLAGLIVLAQLHIPGDKA